MGKYQRKTERRNFSQASLDSALDAIEKGRKIRAVARDFGIHEATLRRHLGIKRKIKDRKSETLGRAPIFSKEQEREIAEQVKSLARLFFGITPTELRQVAYKYAEINHIKHRFNKETAMAGPDWFRSFLKRNSVISLRKPEGTSVSRVSAFNKLEVDRFFDNLEQVLTKNKFGPDRIYNVDETGVSTTPKEVGKRLAPTGVKQFGTICSWERGKNITVICAVSATGNFVPPLFIFPRLRMSPHLQKNGPSGSIYTCTKNGWSNEQVFVMWLKHFQAKYCLYFVLDNHSSHISLPIYEFCKSHGIIMVSIPPHTSHKLQPLDLTFFGPLKNAYSRQCNLFLKRKISNPQEGNTLTPYDVAEIFKVAYEQVANVEKGVSGFAAAGIYPLNSEKFSEEDFAPADSFMSEQPLKEIQLHQSPSSKHLPQELSPQPSTSTQSVPLLPSTSKQPVPSATELYFIPEQIPISTLLPVPKAQAKKIEKNVRKKQHSEVLTSTPFKQNLEEKENKRNRKAMAVAGKINATVKTKKKGKVVRKVYKESDSDSEISVDEKEICDDDELDDISNASEYDQCIICGDTGTKNEMWYRCTICGYWAHSECSGVDSPKGFVCDLCQN
ncbi:hypothetical protein PPYR_12252 [Photinus pyralis]|uniref:DDE-1 domain-containing protein n=1 Tax=Photinus pyralis TaxID=7054 RepID=A0A5N4ADK7_PHOPY|nr:hypothetical protein PPYR_12252 [Photinus pyralis]